MQTLMAVLSTAAAADSAAAAAAAAVALPLRVLQVSTATTRQRRWQEASDAPAGAGYLSRVPSRGLVVRYQVQLFTTHELLAGFTFQQ